jgi:hypothetical protein
MRRVVRSVPRRRRYAALAILALAVAAVAALTTGSVTFATAGGTTADTCGYSGNSTTLPPGARSTIKFNEIGIIEGFSVTSDANSNPLTVNTFYSDEHALTIGATGTTWVATYVDPGTTITRIDDAGTNPAGVGSATPGPTPTSLDTGAPATDPYGREVAPSLYLTDVSGANSASKAGDWQNQTAPNQPEAQRPNYVGGTWKNNGAANPLGSDGKEAKNGADLGPHSETFVQNISTSQGIEGYGAEVRWDVSSLDTDQSTAGIQAAKPGHTYRVQMMFHDGDHNADTGEACTTFTVPPAHPAGTTLADGGGQLQPDPNDPTGLSVTTHDTANLSNGTANAGPDGSSATSGQLTFRLYKQSTGTATEARCHGGTLPGTPVKTVTIDADNGANGTPGDYDTANPGVYSFPDVTLNVVGTYHWTVQYSGNTENAAFPETACLNSDELVTVSQAPSEVHTSPNVKITEDVNIKLSASASAGIKAGDTVTIKLFKQGTGTTVGCTALNTAGGFATQQGSTKTVTLSSSNIDPNTGEVDLGQLIYPDDFQPNAPALGSGTYFWAVAYGGNSQVSGSNDDCTEVFSITLP